MHTKISFQSDEQPFELLCAKLTKDLAENSYALSDHFMKGPEVDALLKHICQLREQGDMKEAGIGAAHHFTVKKNIRKDWIHWIDPKDADPSTQIFISRIRELMGFINRECFLGLKDFEAHYTVYPKGAFYKRHLDQFKVSDHRRLTFICYLNKGWSIDKGGLLRLYLKNRNSDEIPFDILPLAGRLVCFRSDLIEHEVLVSHAERYSLTGWMLDQLNELTFL